MTYLVAILLPFVAFFMVGKPFQGVLALLLQLTVLGWIPAAIWAVMVVSSAQADKRTERVISATRDRQ